MSELTLTKPRRVRINPSRSTCEEIIKRILTTEEKENGTNTHFKNATDFMTYFESLYPSGPALTKQVQRAIKSMDLAKDENGYFLINKTKDQQSKEKELSRALHKTNSYFDTEISLQTVLLHTTDSYKSYLLDILKESDSISKYYTTAIETSNGILFLTPDRDSFVDRISPLLP